MIKPFPTYRQREVLQLLMQGDWTPLLKLIPSGDKLLRSMRIGLPQSIFSRRAQNLCLLARKRKAPAAPIQPKQNPRDWWVRSIGRQLTGSESGVRLLLQFEGRFSLPD